MESKTAESISAPDLLRHAVRDLFDRTMSLRLVAELAGGLDPHLHADIGVIRAVLRKIAEHEPA